MSIGVGLSSQTRSYAPAAYIRSRSASEFLLAQKTELPRLSTVCYRNGLIARLVSSNKPDADALLQCLNSTAKVG